MVWTWLNLKVGWKHPARWLWLSLHVIRTQLTRCLMGENIRLDWDIYIYMYLRSEKAVGGHRTSFVVTILLSLTACMRCVALWSPSPASLGPRSRPRFWNYLCSCGWYIYTHVGWLKLFLCARLSLDFDRNSWYYSNYTVHTKSVI